MLGGLGRALIEGFLIPRRRKVSIVFLENDSRKVGPRGDHLQAGDLLLEVWWGLPGEDDLLLLAVVAVSGGSLWTNGILCFDVHNECK